jgi:hypothetical protein
MKQTGLMLVALIVFRLGGNRGGTLLSSFDNHRVLPSTTIHAKEAVMKQTGLMLVALIVFRLGGNRGGTLLSSFDNHRVLPSTTLHAMEAGCHSKASSSHVVCSESQSRMGSQSAWLHSAPLGMQITSLGWRAQRLSN